MSVRLPSILAASVLLSAITLHAATAKTPMQVSEIRCEYKLNPLGVDRRAPRFSWKLTDADDTPGQCQTAYRVIVASDRRKLDRDKGDLWDSGIVESPQSTLVLYAGKPLASSQECWWKVQSFDKDGNPTRWSEPARELVYEETRWNTLLRMGGTIAVDRIKKYAYWDYPRTTLNKTFNLWPIPQTVIDTNKDVPIAQNPGW